MSAVAEKKAVEKTDAEKPAPQVLTAGESFSKRDAAPVPAVAQPANLMQALAASATNPAMDVVKVKELYAIHKEMMDRAAETAYNEAMALCQAEILPVATNAFNDHTKSGYAKLEAIDTAITPIHTRHGFSISYGTETKNESDPIPSGYMRTVATVRHAGGHKTREHLDLPPDEAGSQGKTNKTLVQAIGSTSTYARRYLKMMIFNVSTRDDKDGNRTGNGSGGKTMDEGIVANHLAKMDEATNEADLMKFFGTAWNAAEELKDKGAQRVFMTKRDELRKVLKGGRR